MCVCVCEDGACVIACEDGGDGWGEDDEKAHVSKKGEKERAGRQDERRKHRTR